MYTSFNARAIGLSLSASETIGIAAQAGFDGVDLLVRDLVIAGERPDSLRQKMDDLGVIGGAFPLPVDWRGDESRFRRDLAELSAYGEIAATLGLRCTGSWVMPEIPENLDGPDGFQDTVAFHLDRLGSIAAVLERSGIRLGLEVIGVERARSGRTPAFITRIGDLKSLLVPLRKAYPNVGILVDTFHLYAANEPAEEALNGGPDSIVWVHVADLPAGAKPDRSQINDSERGLPGDHGVIDNRLILRSLHEMGYEGPVTAEPLSRCLSVINLCAFEAAQTIAASLQSHWPGQSNRNS